MTVGVLLNPPLERTRGQAARYGQGSMDARRSTARSAAEVNKMRPEERLGDKRGSRP